MMSVEEYALDINRDISVVLKKCKELGIDAKENDDLLDDEGITMLDNAFANEPEEEVIEDEIEDEFGENVEVVVQNKKVNNDHVVNKQKLKKKNDVKQKNKKDFQNKKKEMYKNKEKLVSNKATVGDNVVLYKENMTVADLAKELGVNGTELVRKLFNLGVMATLNNAIDFENAEILVLDYKKELKKRLWSVSSNVQTNKILADDAKKTSNMHPNDKMLKLISDIIENDLNKSIDEYELIAKEWVNKYGEKYINNGTKLFGLAENAIGEANRLSKERISEHNSASKVPNEYKKTSKMSSISIPEHNSALKIDDSVKKNDERVIEKSGTPENKAYKERLKEYKNWNPGKYSDEQLKKMAKADASEETASYIQYLQDCGLSAQKIHEKYGYSIDTIRSAMSW